MRITTLLAALAAFAPAMALACNISVGDVKFKPGYVESTSVVKGTNAEAVLDDDAVDALEALQEKQKDTPVAIMIGTFQASLALKDVLDDDRFTIPGKSTSDGLILQQEFKRCID